jgi:Helix-turn-helix of DDE superfamily endonuclease
VRCPLSAARLHRSASFRRLTGISAATFEQMLKRLQAPWTEMQRSKRKSSRPWEIGGLEDHLLVLLLYYHCTVTQEFLGFFYRVDRSVICRAIQRIEGPVQRLFGIRRAPQISRAEAEALIVVNAV